MVIAVMVVEWLNTIVTGPVKIWHVGTNYTPLHNISYRSTGIEYFHCVTCSLKSQLNI